MSTLTHPENLFDGPSQEFNNAPSERGVRTREFTPNAVRHENTIDTTFADHKPDAVERGGIGLVNNVVIRRANHIHIIKKKELTPDEIEQSKRETRRQAERELFIKIGTFLGIVLPEGSASLLAPILQTIGASGRYAPGSFAGYLTFGLILLNVALSAVRRWKPEFVDRQDKKFINARNKHFYYNPKLKVTHDHLLNFRLFRAVPQEINNLAFALAKFPAFITHFILEPIGAVGSLFRGIGKDYLGVKIKDDWDEMRKNGTTQKQTA